MLASKMFPIEYFSFLFIQIVILLISYSIVRIIAKFGMLKAICVSFMTAGFFSLIFLVPDIRKLFGIGKMDADEYLLVTFIIVTPFCLILIGKSLLGFIDYLGKWTSSENFAADFEKSRILQMVEENKITAEEGCELLDAMGRASALRGEEKFSRIDMVMLVAVSMVILGFFLPWAYIRLPQIPGMFGQIKSAYQAGYHAGALGWAVFIIAVLSVVPVFITPKNYLYKISMLQIFLTVIGIVLIISILFQVGKQLGIGLIICLFGFIFALIASSLKFKKLAA